MQAPWTFSSVLRSMAQPVKSARWAYKPVTATNWSPAAQSVQGTVALPFVVSPYNFSWSGAAGSVHRRPRYHGDLQSRSHVRVPQHRDSIDKSVYGYYDTKYLLRPLLVNWVEGEVTWNQSRQGVPWLSPGALAQGGDVATGYDAVGDAMWNPGWLAFDVTSGVQAIVGGRTNRGWLIEPVSGNGNAKIFYSKEYTANTALRPMLTVRYTASVPNVAPTVTLTTPAAGQSFVQGSAIALAATASDTDGTVSRVEFYANGAKLGEDTSAPYNFSWSGAAVGGHTLSAVAYDNVGASKTSSVVSITVTASVPNVAPTVALTTPAAGQSFVQGSAIALAATASDTDGTVSRVEFYANGAKLGEDTSAPYNFSWSGAAVGGHTLSAVAYDNVGASKTSSVVSITVTASVPNVAPTVALTTPAAGQSFVQGSAIALAATASDTDGTVSRVEFYANGAKLGEDTSAPYNFSWSGAAVGGHTLSAVAYDNVGASKTSAVVSVSVVAGGPGGEQTVTLQSGLNGYAGATDAYMYEYHNTVNFGAAQFLQDKAAISRFRSLMRFAIFQSEGGPVPDGATITQATLSLYKYGYYDTKYLLRPLLVNWVEGEVTWNQSRQGVPWLSPGALALGGDVATGYDAVGDALWNPGWLAFDVTSGVQAIVGGRINRGWLIEPVSGNGNAKIFYSKEYTANTALRPMLTVRYR